MSGQQVGLTANPARGAFISTAYVSREVKAYAVFENEFDTISRLNALSTVWFSLCSAFASLAIGIWVNAAFVDKLTPQGDILCHVVAPGLCSASVVTLMLGGWSVLSRRSTWSKIRRESVSPSAN
jgi:hypothetical protein